MSVSYQQKHSPSKLPPSPRARGDQFQSDLIAKRLLSGPLLEITVGPEGKKWHVHHNLLRHHSSFFDEADLINGEEKKIKDGKVDLSEEDPKAFRILVKWLYQGQIEDVSKLDKDKKWDYAFACQNLYVLCEHIDIRELKNLAIDQFRKGCYETRLVPGADEIKPVYDRLPPTSPFRKLVSRIAARQLMDPDSKRDASIYKECFQATPDFAVDVLNAIREGSDGLLLDDPTEGNSCRYHEHQNGDTCHKTVRFGDAKP
ncbi:hypothetical protein PMZ80_005934 [Knufia obscura]|uniref:BTB domain-containing protein n=1 Tax=Knufia obscura TaxID=1635080 RepID=A0ABR0RN45_9EURO|nr:hypothetical protein PMZ80_005934 [Knufia obscura]